VGVGRGGEAHGLNWKDFGSVSSTSSSWWASSGNSRQEIAAFFGAPRADRNQLSDLEPAKSKRKAFKDHRGSSPISTPRSADHRGIPQAGEARRDSIVAAAEDKAVQIKAQAAVTAEQETKLAVERLRAELADLVVEAARGMLAGKLSEKDQDKLVDEYLTKVVFN
jgi:F-type H+-transporting ATPase subunit b